MKKNIVVVEKKEVAVYQTQGKELVERFEGREILTASDMSDAVEVLSRMNQIMDAAEESKQEVLTPLNAARTAELKRWKPFENWMGPAVENLRRKIGAYQTIQKRKADEAAAKIAARTGEGKGKLKVETAVKKLGEIDKPAESVVAESGSLKFRTDKILKVMDETLIPREYFDLNSKRVLDALKAGVNVPGAVIEEVQTPINSR